MSEPLKDLSDRLEPFFDDVDILIRRIGDLGRHDLKGKRLPDSDPGFPKPRQSPSSRPPVST